MENINELESKGLLKSLVGIGMLSKIFNKKNQTKQDVRNKKDFLKVLHYAMLLLHFDDHYGKPNMTSGNIDHNMP